MQSHNDDGDQCEEPKVWSIEVGVDGRMFIEQGNGDAYVQASGPDWYNLEDIR